MTASQIPQAADIGRPKQRLYYLLQERHRRITNRIWGQSLREVDSALQRFANELCDGFKAVFKTPERKTVSGSYITLFWKDKTEVTVKLDGHTDGDLRDHNRAPWLQCQKVNDHRRRVQLRKNETPEQIVIRVMDHFRNTDSELSTALSWKVRDGSIRFDSNTVSVLTPRPVTVRLRKIQQA